MSLHKLDQLRGFALLDNDRYRIGNYPPDEVGIQRNNRVIPALAAAAGGMGSPQIRNRATIGGNLISSRPAADTIGPLIVLNALVRLQGES